MNVILGIVRAYFDAVLSREALAAAQQALRSANADLSQAENVRQTGMSTDADVLSIRVHVASVREQEIRRAADVKIADAALSDVLGLPMDISHTLTTPLTEARRPILKPSMSLSMQRSSETRADPVELRYSDCLDAVERSSIILLAHLGLLASFEVDRQDFAAKAGTNSLFAASLTWNLFNGFSDMARLEEAKASVLRAQADARRVRSAVQTAGDSGSSGPRSD